MMMSLFSMFDPSSIWNSQINWILMNSYLLILPLFFWKSKSRSASMLQIMIMNLNKEFMSLFSNNVFVKGTTLIMISLFLIICFNNLTSNYPYIFCCSAQLVFSMALSLPIWSSMMMFFWMNLNKTMFSHLVPSGTPTILMPLMVMIELTSNIIRPLALAVRLTANLIAGHLLMALLGNTFNLNSTLSFIILVIQMMFLTFEMMVALIQSYVFSVLMTLYSSEIS
uniref:ATP synthase subunit a n=1 Tax=Aacanthocnema dobsoni TaxID=399255 RepID=A0A344A208_9HEMI|nr:ATP synthase F0 subunit 6 [Aacanthocnema dobsoni]AWU48799.1 ATP synthase F0 subunit 6 [Aacanthocnema dobsoni]